MGIVYTDIIIPAKASSVQVMSVIIRPDNVQSSQEGFEFFVYHLLSRTL